MKSELTGEDLIIIGKLHTSIMESIEKYVEPIEDVRKSFDITALSLSITISAIIKAFSMTNYNMFLEDLVKAVNIFHDNAIKENIPMEEISRKIAKEQLN